MSRQNHEAHCTASLVYNSSTPVFSHLHTSRRRVSTTLNPIAPLSQITPQSSASQTAPPTSRRTKKIEPQPLHLHRHDYYPTRQTTPGCAQLTSTTSWTKRGPRFFFLLFTDTDTELDDFNELKLKLKWMVRSNRKCRND